MIPYIRFIGAYNIWLFIFKRHVQISDSFLVFQIQVKSQTSLVENLRFLWFLFQSHSKIIDSSNILFRVHVYIAPLHQKFFIVGTLF